MRRTLIHALLGAVLELIERDAVATWWYNRLHRPEIDLDSFEDLRIGAASIFLHGHGLKALSG